MVLWAMNQTRLAGPLNITAPEPVRNSDFGRTLGRVLHRPSFVPTPALALRLALGELADTALLSSLRALPAAALAEGFEFRYPQLEGALRAIY
jgi:NAD dependent epimerase/dehydratase family enzyme